MLNLEIKVVYNFMRTVYDKIFMGVILMPLIDYKCKKCSEEFFEIVNGNSEKIVCPKCKSEEVERVYKGKFYGKNGGNCSGNCSSCGGCH